MLPQNEAAPIPRVSVLMTIYNTASFLRQSIESLLAQSFTDWELIALENGSTDDSPSILLSYADPRIRVFSFSKNIGRTPGLRHAFDQARGEYIAVLDADDVSRYDRLTRQVAFLDAHPETVLVGAWAEHMDEQGRVFDRWEPPADPGKLLDIIARRNPIVHSSAMYRRSQALCAGGYPLAYTYAQDFALILALARQGQVTVIPEHLCRLRVFPGSMTRSGEYYLTFLREELALLKYAGKTLSFSLTGRVINILKVLKCQAGYSKALFYQHNKMCGEKIR
ncbi:MAG: glycosyltransferase family 2 protein [Candidatus Omnitrophota bacterium]